MPESFGTRLRQRREQRQVALTSIADETKIKLSLLEALEHDNVSHWPSGIFRRAYIRAYAHMIGLDPDDTLREFLELYPEPADMFEAAAMAPGTPEDSRSGPPTRLRTMMDTAIGSLARLRKAGGIEDGAPQGTRLGVRPALDSVQPAAATPAAAKPADPPPRRAAADVLPEPVNEAIAAPMPPEPPPVPLEETVRPADTLTLMPSDPVERTESHVPVHMPADPPEELAAAPERADQSIAAAPPPAAKPQTPPEYDLEAVAGLCTAFARVRAVDRNEIQQLLQEAARELNALGLIVWLWDTIAEELAPALVHGYSERVLAQLPPVKRDDDNFTAAAFRSAQTREVKATDHASGALVLPLLKAEGCVGVLAIELQPGVRNTRTVRAVATILAAVLAPLAERSHAADLRAPVERPAPAVDALRSPVRPIRVRR